MTDTALTLNRRSETRGFTLTEIAIVLGIIGIILAAIWVAASSVYNNQRIGKANTELLALAQNIRAMNSGGLTVDPNATTATYITAAIPPTDMVNGATLSSPWTTAVTLGPAFSNSANDSFYVGFASIPQGPCGQFVAMTTGSGRDSALQAVQNGAPSNAGTNAASTFPMTVSTAVSGTGVCSAATNTVYWVFRLKG